MIRETVKQYYEKIVPLNYIVRYSNVPRIKDETVAEHSFLVAAIVVKLYERYEFDIGWALTMAVCHDLPEYAVNDVTHAIKRDHPAVAAALHDAEREVIKTLPEVAQRAYTEFEEQSTREAFIVHLADVIQCSQYAENEVQLGNKERMEKIAITSRQRATYFRHHLERWLR